MACFCVRMCSLPLSPASSFSSVLGPICFLSPIFSFARRCEALLFRTTPECTFLSASFLLRLESSPTSQKLPSVFVPFASISCHAFSSNHPVALNGSKHLEAVPNPLTFPSFPFSEVGTAGQCPPHFLSPSFFFTFFHVVFTWSFLSSLIVGQVEC